MEHKWIKHSQIMQKKKIQFSYQNSKISDAYTAAGQKAEAIHFYFTY